MTSNYYKLVAWFEELDETEIEIYNEMSYFECCLSLSETILMDYQKTLPIEEMFNLTYEEHKAWVNIVNNKYYGGSDVKVL